MQTEPVGDYSAGIALRISEIKVRSFRKKNREWKVSGITFFLCNDKGYAGDQNNTEKDVKK